MKNLWPDFKSFGDTQTPKDVLLTQAENLNIATNGLIQGTIKSREVRLGTKIEESNEVENDNFIHIFNVFAPRLKYSFNLLTVRHQTIKIYPCNVSAELADTKSVADSEKDLEEILEKIFKHPEVFMAIESLILQSKAERENEIQAAADDDLPF